MAMGRVFLAAWVCVAAGVWCGGCVQYANYPAIGDDLAVNNPNVEPMPTVMREALDRVITADDPGGLFAVNLPAGMERARAERLVGSLDEDAVLVSERYVDEPTYHIKRVWIRGDRARVEVVRPVAGVGSHQSVTVGLKRRGLAGWRVESVRAWTVGAGEEPELNVWGEVEDGGGGS